MKTIKESMNLDYSDFDYKKFKNWIIRYLEDYGCEVNTVEIICDDYGYDVEIDVENAENLPSRISDKEYGAFIFDAMYTTSCLYLKMPIVRAMKTAEEFSPKVLKVNDDSILIGDKNSDTEIWLDVWTDNDGDDEYVEWDYNQQSFNLNKYEDMVQKYLQQIDDFFYILDGVVSDNFPLTESKKTNRKSIKESKDIIIEEFISNYKNNDCFSIRDKENGHESECFWGSKKDVLDSDYRLFTVLDTDVNKETDDIILYIDLEENAWVESKKSARKSIEESKVMTFEEFKKLCNDNFGYAIMDFNEYKGAYLVVVSSNEKATELFTKALRKKGLECTFYELQNPNSEYYRCYEIMCV